MRLVTDRALKRDGSSGRLQRNARAALVVGLLALGLWIIHDFFAALIWAAIFAVALWPIYGRALRAWPGGQHIALPALFTTVVALVFIIPLLLIALQVARESHDFVQRLQGFELSGIPLPGWVASLPFGKQQVTDWWNTNLTSPFDSNALLRHVNRGSVISVTREFGAKFAHRIVIFAFTLLTMFFLFKEGRSLSRAMLQASHQLFGPKGEHIARQMVASIHGTVDGLVLVGIGEGVVIGIGYYFAAVPHPVLLGAVTAVAAMIPFGAFVIFGGVTLFLAAQGHVAAAATILILGIIVVGIADHLVRPALIGGATKLPFVWVLLGILGGVETFGLLGLFLGPAVMSALILLWRELVASHVADNNADLAA